MMSPPVLAITIGDPNGVGPEVILKALSHDSLRASIRPLLIGPAAIFENWRNRLGLNLPIRIAPHPDVVMYDPDNLYVWTPDHCEEVEWQPGRVTRNGGAVAGACVEAAAELAMNGIVGGMVTAPASKEALLLSGYSTPGHSDLLANLVGVDVVTMLVWERMRCALYTLHCPLMDVSRELDRDKLMRKLRTIDHALDDWFGVEEARIGMCGLNPHASDGGLFGQEEMSILAPVVLKAQREGLHVSGPLGADTLFLSWENYDCILALYHDQGAVPMLVASHGHACYFSAGLPFLRVAPGQGAAFDIAGKGVADGSRMVDAIRLATDMLIERSSRTPRPELS